jgi:hypothetical protein
VCFDFTNYSAANWQTMDNYYGITVTDVDGINETFNLTNHPIFQVGSRNFSSCPTTYVFQNDQRQENNFVNVLLFDPTINDTGWIYTTLIENKSIADSERPALPCYDGQFCDFQILVNENGHGTDTVVTPYFFWVELI